MNPITEYHPIRPVEPPALLVDGADLTVWRYREGDASGVIIRIGMTGDIGADTLDVPDHLVATLLATLQKEVRL